MFSQARLHGHPLVVLEAEAPEALQAPVPAPVLPLAAGAAELPLVLQGASASQPRAQARALPLAPPLGQPRALPLALPLPSGPLLPQPASAVPVLAPQPASAVPVLAPQPAAAVQPLEPPPEASELLGRAPPPLPPYRDAWRCAATLQPPAPRPAASELLGRAPPPLPPHLEAQHWAAALQAPAPRRRRGAAAAPQPGTALELLASEILRWQPPAPPQPAALPPSDAGLLPWLRRGAGPPPRGLPIAAPAAPGGPVLPPADTSGGGGVGARVVPRLEALLRAQYGPLSAGQRFAVEVGGAAAVRAAALRIHPLDALRQCMVGQRVRACVPPRQLQQLGAPQHFVEVDIDAGGLLCG
jgi:hypothetical protein